MIIKKVDNHKLLQPLEILHTDKAWSLETYIHKDYVDPQYITCEIKLCYRGILRCTYRGADTTEEGAITLTSYCALKELITLGLSNILRITKEEGWTQ